MIALGSIETQAFAYITGQGEIGAVTDHYFSANKTLIAKIYCRSKSTPLSQNDFTKITTKVKGKMNYPAKYFVLEQGELPEVSGGGLLDVF